MTAGTAAALFHQDYEARLTGPWTDIQDQLPILYERACRYQVPRILEFGVRTGESTAAFCAAAARRGGHVWSYDIAAPQVPAWWWDTGIWSFFRQSSLDAAAGPGDVDVLFLDTGHTYEDTVRELRRWVPAVAPGGRVLCHDTLLDTPGFEPFAVADALRDYCAETHRTWIELGGRFGLGEIRIPKEGQDG